MPKSARGKRSCGGFFQAGAAAGTIAKSISAYDMTVSDAIYGESPRYVSRARLETMLQYEYDLLTDRLAENRDAPQFFAFANTVRARTYRGSDECHGWMGIRYQATPGGEPSQILTHVRMLDRENQVQQEALGVLGVNLIYAAFEHFEKPDRLLRCLLDDLSTERIEVDMVKLSGPAFEDVDSRIISLKLVQLGLSQAAMFATDGSVLHAAEVLYKKPILVERGALSPGDVRQFGYFRERTSAVLAPLRRGQYRPYHGADPARFARRRRA